MPCCPVYSHTHTQQHPKGIGNRQPGTVYTSLNVADAKNPIEDCANNESEARADSDQPQKGDQYTSLGYCPSSRLRQGKESKAQKPKTDTVVAYRICGKHIFDAFVNPITELTAAQGRRCKHRISGSQTNINDKGSRQVCVEDESNERGTHESSKCRDRAGIIATDCQCRFANR